MYTNLYTLAAAAAAAAPTPAPTDAGLPRFGTPEAAALLAGFGRTGATHSLLEGGDVYEGAREGPAPAAAKAKPRGILKPEPSIRKASGARGLMSNKGPRLINRDGTLEKRISFSDDTKPGDGLLAQQRNRKGHPVFGMRKPGGRKPGF